MYNLFDRNALNLSLTKYSRPNLPKVKCSPRCNNWSDQLSMATMCVSLLTVKQAVEKHFQWKDPMMLLTKQEVSYVNF